VLRNYPGYAGMFTRNEARGAIPNGRRVMKTNSEAGDGTPDGALGTVLGSIVAPDTMGRLMFYFVEWDRRPRLAAGISGYKIVAATSPNQEHNEK
jgi:hypothetical protein